MNQKSWKLHMKIMIWTIMEKLASSLFSRHSTTRKNDDLPFWEWENKRQTNPHTENITFLLKVEFSDLCFMCANWFGERERTNNSGMFNRISFLDWLDNAYLHLVGILQWRDKPVVQLIGWHSRIWRVGVERWGRIIIECVRRLIYFLKKWEMMQEKGSNSKFLSIW